MSRRPGLSPALGFGLLAVAGVAVPVLTRDSYYLDVATTLLMNLVLTLSLRLEMSTGQLNMAHISFMGVGAYASVLLVTRAGWSFWASLAVAPLVAALVAVPVGRIALRVSGPYYFLITFAFLEVLRLFFNNFFVDYLGGPSGLAEIPRPHPLPPARSAPSAALHRGLGGEGGAVAGRRSADRQAPAMQAAVRPKR